MFFLGFFVSRGSIKIRAFSELTAGGDAHSHASVFTVYMQQQKNQEVYRMKRRLTAGITLICSLVLILTGSGTIGASTVVSTASSPETLVVTVATNDFSESSPSGEASAVSGTVSFGSFVGEERIVNEAIKMNVRSNGQWSMQVQADPMTSSAAGEENIQLPAEQFQKRAAVGLGSDTDPQIVIGQENYSNFLYDVDGTPLNSYVVEDAAATGDSNGTTINIGLKTKITYADLARDYQSTVTVTTTAAY